jgi:hypothetical protein
VSIGVIEFQEMGSATKRERLNSLERERLNSPERERLNSKPANPITAIAVLAAIRPSKIRTHFRCIIV